MVLLQKGYIYTLICTLILFTILFLHAVEGKRDSMDTKEALDHEKTYSKGQPHTAGGIFQFFNNWIKPTPTEKLSTKEISDQATTPGLFFQLLTTRYYTDILNQIGKETLTVFEGPTQPTAPAKLVQPTTSLASSAKSKQKTTLRKSVDLKLSAIFSDNTCSFTQVEDYSGKTSDTIFIIVQKISQSLKKILDQWLDTLYGDIFPVFTRNLRWLFSQLIAAVKLITKEAYNQRFPSTSTTWKNFAAKPLNYLFFDFDKLYKKLKELINKEKFRSTTFQKSPAQATTASPAFSTETALQTFEPAQKRKQYGVFNMTASFIEWLTEYLSRTFDYLTRFFQKEHLVLPAIESDFYDTGMYHKRTRTRSKSHHLKSASVFSGGALRKSAKVSTSSGTATTAPDKFIPYNTNNDVSTLLDMYNLAIRAVSFVHFTYTASEDSITTTQKNTAITADDRICTLATQTLKWAINLIEEEETAEKDVKELAIDTLNHILSQLENHSCVTENYVTNTPISINDIATSTLDLIHSLIEKDVETYQREDTATMHSTKVRETQAESTLEREKRFDQSKVYEFVIKTFNFILGSKKENGKKDADTSKSPKIPITDSYELATRTFNFILELIDRAIGGFTFDNESAEDLTILEEQLPLILVDGDEEEAPRSNKIAYIYYPHNTFYNFMVKTYDFFFGWIRRLFTSDSQGSSRYTTKFIAPSIISDNAGKKAEIVILEHAAPAITEGKSNFFTTSVNWISQAYITLTNTLTSTLTLTSTSTELATVTSTFTSIISTKYRTTKSTTTIIIHATATRLSFKTLTSTRTSVAISTATSTKHVTATTTSTYYVTRTSTKVFVGPTSTSTAKEVATSTSTKTRTCTVTNTEVMTSMQTLWRTTKSTLARLVKSTGTTTSFRTLTHIMESTLYATVTSTSTVIATKTHLFTAYSTTTSTKTKTKTIEVQQTLDVTYFKDFIVYSTVTMPITSIFTSTTIAPLTLTFTDWIGTTRISTALSASPVIVPTTLYEIITITTSTVLTDTSLPTSIWTTTSTGLAIVTSRVNEFITSTLKATETIRDRSTITDVTTLTDTTRISVWVPSCAHTSTITALVTETQTTIKVIPTVLFSFTTIIVPIHTYETLIDTVRATSTSTKVSNIVVTSTSISTVISLSTQVATITDFVSATYTIESTITVPTIAYETSTSTMTEQATSTSSSTVTSLPTEVATTTNFVSATSTVFTTAYVPTVALETSTSTLTEFATSTSTVEAVFTMPTIAFETSTLTEYATSTSTAVATSTKYRTTTLPFIQIVTSFVSIVPTSTVDLTITIPTIAFETSTSTLIDFITSTSTHVAISTSTQHQITTIPITDYITKTSTKIETVTTTSTSVSTYVTPTISVSTHTSTVVDIVTSTSTSIHTTVSPTLSISTHVATITLMATDTLTKREERTITDFATSTSIQVEILTSTSTIISPSVSYLTHVDTVTCKNTISETVKHIIKDTVTSTLTELEYATTTVVATFTSIDSAYLTYTHVATYTNIQPVISTQTHIATVTSTSTAIKTTTGYTTVTFTRTAFAATKLTAQVTHTATSTITAVETNTETTTMTSTLTAFTTITAEVTHTKTSTIEAEITQTATIQELSTKTSTSTITHTKTAAIEEKIYATPMVPSSVEISDGISKLAGSVQETSTSSANICLYPGATGLLSSRPTIHTIAKEKAKEIPTMRLRGWLVPLFEYLDPPARTGTLITEEENKRILQENQQAMGIGTEAKQGFLALLIGLMHPPAGKNRFDLLLEVFKQLFIGLFEQLEAIFYLLFYFYRLCWNLLHWIGIKIWGLLTFYMFYPFFYFYKTCWDILDWISDMVFDLLNVSIFYPAYYFYKLACNILDWVFSIIWELITVHWYLILT